LLYVEPEIRDSSTEIENVGVLKGIPKNPLMASGEETQPHEQLSVGVH
jgi:hypothetical protein